MYSSFAASVIVDVRLFSISTCAMNSIRAIIYFTSVIVLVIYFSSTSVQSDEKKPNVVFIVADDLGWNDMGFHGMDQIPTPNIDALAYSGIILQNYYVLPVCTPSRSALMTGKHPINTGMQHRVLFGNEPWGLPLDLKIFPQYLKDDGYKTHAVGKWHLGHCHSNYTPLSRGFDSHFGYWTGRQDYFDHSAQESGTYWGYDMRRGMNVSWDSFTNYSTDLFTDEAVQIIKSHDPSSPLFLYVAHLAVHSANMYQFLQAPKQVIKKFDYIQDANRRTYAAMLWKLDESVGKIVEALSDKGLLQNTIVVFTSDNGGPAAGFNNNAASNWPLRGVKDTLWEGGVRGGALVWSTLLPSSKISNHLMHIQDWLPTILAAVNSTNLKANLTFDGHNVWPLLKGEQNSTDYDEILLNIDQLRNMSALRKGDWKVISGEIYDGKWDGWYGPSGRGKEFAYNFTELENSMVARAFKNNNITFPTRQTINALRKNASVLCRPCNNQPCNSCNLKTEKYCLFNVRTDPCENHNRANDEPEILSILLQALETYKPVQPLNQPADPSSHPKYWNYTWTNWLDFENKSVD